MSFQNFRNWLCDQSGIEICIFVEKEDDVWKHHSQEEWDALTENRQHEIMEKRMEGDTRTFSGFEKGSEEHRKLLEKEDRLRREAIERERDPYLETE